MFYDADVRMLSGIRLYFLPSRAGVTLIELLVVIAILSILLGMGSGFFSHLGERQILSNATLHMYNIFRTSQQIAREQNSDSWVKVYPNTPARAELWGSKIVGFWRMDDTIITGAFGKHAKGENVQNCLGKINAAVQVFPETRLFFGDIREFGILNGFSLRMWLYLERSASKEQILWEWGPKLYWKITSEQKLSLTLPTDETIVSQTGLLVYQWNYLELTHNGQKFRAYINHIPSLEHSLAQVGMKDMYLGPGVRGKVDQVQLLAWNLMEEYTVPTSISVTSPKEISFFPNGHLSPYNSQIPVVITLTKEDAESLKPKVHFSKIEIRALGQISWTNP